MPVYNEEPALLRRCLESIARQDHRPLEVIVVDDGSDNRAEHDAIYAEYTRLDRWTVLQERVNRGKRMAQKLAFDRATGDVIVTIDSDTLLRTPDAIRRIQFRFADRQVGAVSGSVGVENEGRNVLTRLIASRYWMAFNQERAAQSLFGVTMCCSGPFSAFRGELIRGLKEEYVVQSFFGRRCTFGDDRHLTNLILRAGYRVVYDDNAHAKTNVPDTLRCLPAPAGALEQELLSRGPVDRALRPQTEPLPCLRPAAPDRPALHAHDRPGRGRLPGSRGRRERARPLGRLC